MWVTQCKKKKEKENPVILRLCITWFCCQDLQTLISPCRFVCDVNWLSGLSRRQHKGMRKCKASNNSLLFYKYNTQAAGVAAGNCSPFKSLPERNDNQWATQSCHCPEKSTFFSRVSSPRKPAVTTNNTPVSETYLCGTFPPVFPRSISFIHY